MVKYRTVISSKIECNYLEISERIECTASGGMDERNKLLMHIRIDGALNEMNERTNAFVLRLSVRSGNESV